MEELEMLPKKEKKQHIWVEKYRPNKLEDYLGNNLVKDMFRSYVANQDFCHLLLCGGPGTGKTTLAKLLVKAVSCDSIYINASDERGIGMIREKIKSFAGSSGFKPLKVIILDEADFMTGDAQASLRPIMEMYSLNTRIIMTGNYHEKISDPIKSRVQAFELSPPTKKEVALHVINILKLEGITFKNEDLATIINTSYPDIRKTIQLCQQNSLSGELKLSNTTILEQDIKNKLVEMLKIRKPFAEIRKFVLDQGLTRFEDVYEYLYENLDKFAEGKQPSVILNLAEGIKNDTMVINKQIVFLATIIEILNSLKV